MGDLLKSGIVVSPDKDEGRSMRLGRGRLCYEFAPENTTLVISVDVNSGEVGGLTLSYLGAHGLNTDDPLRVFLPFTWEKP